MSCLSPPTKRYHRSPPTEILPSAGLLAYLFHRCFLILLLYVLFGPLNCIYRCKKTNPRLPTLENRLPLLLKRLESLIPVLRVNNPPVHFILLLLPRPSNSLQSGTNGNRPALANLLRQPNGLGERGPAGSLQDVAALGPVSSSRTAAAGVALVLGQDLDEAVGDAEEVRLGGGDAAAGEDEVAGAGEADDGGEAVCAAGAGDDAEAGLGETDGGV